MRKIVFIKVILIVIVLITSCNKIENNNFQETDKPTESANPIATLNPSNSPEKTQRPVRTPSPEKTYTNLNCGYIMTIPQSWIGYYYIEDSDPESIYVYFYGKSITGSKLYGDIVDGLPLFLIISENNLDGTYDGVTKIGTSRGLDYYQANMTGSDINALHSRAFAKSSEDEFWINDEIERELVKKDSEKVFEMMEDLEIFLNSFEEI